VAAKILIAENDEFYLELVTKILDEEGHSYVGCRTEDELSSAITGFSFDLALLDTSFLASNNEVILQLRRHREVPIVLVTSSDKMKYYYRFFAENNISQVLKKPFKARSLIKIMEKLLDPRPEFWFGMQNYISDITIMKRVEISNSSQIRPTILAAKEYFEKWGAEYTPKMNLVWQEVLTNAVYHAHGMQAEKDAGLPITLPADKRVQVRFGASKHRMGFSVRDFSGSLTAYTVLDSVARVASRKMKIDEALEAGQDLTADLLEPQARGFDIIRSLSGEYYIIIDPGKSTEIILVYEDFLFERDDSYAVLKVFELPAGR